MSIHISKSEKFYDGHTSKAHKVSVILSGSILHLQDENQKTIHSWTLDKITIIERPIPPAPAILSYIKSPDARLHITNKKGWEYLKSRLAQKGKKSSRHLPTHWSSFGAYGLVSVLSLIFIFLLFPRVMGGLAYLMPLSWEKTLGHHISASMTNGEKGCTKAEGKAALDKLQRTLQKTMKRKIPYDIHVIDDPYFLNAFALPGGYIFLYRKVIDDATTPEEVAGILAHEMAHIELYHTTKSVVRDLGLGFTLSMVFGGNASSMGDIARILSQMGYSREDESAADMHAIQTLKQLNISPAGLQDFLTRVHEQEWDIDFEGQEYLEYISTHPDTEKRIAAIKINKDTNYTPAMSKKEWSALRSICDQTKDIKLME